MISSELWWLLLPCLFSNDIQCEFVKRSTFGMMDRCLTCEYFLRAMWEMEQQDEVMMDDVDRELERPVNFSPSSVEAVDYSFSNRLALNHQILDNAYWYSSVDNKGHEDFQPVGRGSVFGSQCGAPRGLRNCKNVEGHNGVHIHGIDCTGKDIWLLEHWFCNKSSCPKCFIRGWATRRARSITGRINEGVKRGFGEVEHMTVSPPVSDWNLSLAGDLLELFFRSKCRNALFVRGITGGCMIFHGFHINDVSHVLEWHPHYHVLGWIKGGYDRCRNCCIRVPSAVRCRDCDGFEARTRKYNESDGCIVKVAVDRFGVAGKRESVGATAWYQMNHATIRVGMKRFQSFSWFGNCGNRKFKSTPLKAEVRCPACREEMDTRVPYMGGHEIVRDIGSPAYKRMFVDDHFGEDGLPNSVDIDRRRL